MFTKRFILAVLLLFLFTASVSLAQSDGKKHKGNHKSKTPTEKATKVADKMQKKLSLTDGQRTSVYSVLYSHFTEMQNLRSSDTDKKSDEYKSMKKEKRAELKKELSTILTDDQLKTWEKGKKKRKGKKKNKNKDKSSDDRPLK